jgi:hypothetical protein
MPSRSRQTNDRKLAGREIELVIHLLKSGAATTPISVIASAQQVAIQLWRLGIVHKWSRQSRSLRRPEGPYYSLTRAGTYRAEALMLSRHMREMQARNASNVETTPPPHDR